VVLTLVSGGALYLLASSTVLPSTIRNPLSAFVQPGVTVWWFVLGGPFRSAPSQLSGLVFAALANGVLWLAVAGFATFVYRAVRRRFGGGAT
jgi:hypothetical protein